MRVICYGRFCDDQPGGIETHVDNLLGALRDQVDFLRLAPARDRSAARFIKDGIPVVRTPGWSVDGSLTLSPGLILETWRQYRQQPCDLVHLHFPDPMAHLASLAIPAHVPRLITWHADITRQRRLLKLYQPLQSAILRQARAIIVATPAHFQTSGPLQAPGLAAKVEVIPYGFALERFVAPHPERAALIAAHPGRRIFALGRHVAYKGFPILLQALARLPADVRLILGGQGPLSDALRAQANALGLAARIDFPGRIPAHRLPAYYQACDVFCLPSVTQAEAFGIVQVEAMAAGKPVVGTALGNGVECVNQHGKTGLSVPPGDPEALAAALAALLDDPARARALGAQARTHVLAHYSQAAMAERTLALYRRIAAKP